MKKYLIACWITGCPKGGICFYSKKYSKSGAEFVGAAEDKKNLTYLTKLLSLMKIARNKQVQISTNWTYRTKEVS